MKCVQTVSAAFRLHKMFVNARLPPSPVEPEEVYAYRLGIQWRNIPKQSFEWMEDFQGATNCSHSLLISALMAMTRTLCGPSTSVTSGTFTTTLNEYTFAVGDPGRRKSNTFNRVVEPVMDEIEKILPNKVLLETYTIAGIHKHQTNNGGYGLITGDEG